MAEWNHYDMTISNLAEGASISRINAYKILDIWKKKKIVEETRKIGRSRFFRLNKENEISKEFIGLLKAIVSEFAKQNMKDEKSKTRIRMNQYETQ